MKNLLLLFLFFFTNLSFGQSSLDSLRLVLPIGHRSAISSISFSPDGKHVISYGQDNYAIIWDISSGKELHRLIGHTQRITDASFNSLSNKIVTSSEDGTIRVWSGNNGKLIFKLEGHDEEVNTAKFSPDGKFILSTSSDKTSILWDTFRGKQVYILKGHIRPISVGVFSPNGELLLTAGYDNKAIIYEVISGRQIYQYEDHKDAVLYAEFSKDSKYFVTSSWDGTARVYDSHTGSEISTLVGHKSWVFSARFNKDGSKIVTAGKDYTARIWKVKDGEEIACLSGHNNEIQSSDFSPDDKYIITGSHDGKIGVWESDKGNNLRFIDLQSEAITDVKFSQDGKLLLSAGMDNCINVFAVQTLSKIKVLKGCSIGVQSAHNNFKTQILVNSIPEFNFQFLDIKNPNNVENLFGHKDRITTAKLSDDNRYLISSSEDSTINLWAIDKGELLNVFKGNSFNNYAVFDESSEEILIMSGEDAYLFNILNNKKVLLYPSPEHKIYDGVFSLNSDLIYIASWDGLIYAYSKKTGQLKKRIKAHKGYVKTLNISFDGRFIVTTSGDKTSVIIKIGSKRVFKRLIGHTEYVTSASFSPNGDYILTSSGDHTARLWALNSEKEIFIYEGHLAELNSAYFDTSGKYILTASNDYTAKIWSVDDGKLVRTFRSHEDKVTSALFNSDGKFVVTTSEDHKTILWDVATGNPIYERIQLEKNNWLVKLPNSPYYMCSKDASKMLHYVTPSLKVIGFEQLDPVYNRPDIVLDSIGKYFGGADQELVANYRQSWEKRIDRLGLDKEKLGKGEIAVPNAEIVGADAIAYENKEGKLDIKVSANDPKYPLRRFNVYVNEVPLYGSVGISISHLKKQEWDTTVSVPLSLGENKIQVSVMNELGLENFKYPTYVSYSPAEPVEAKTYYIGIGVNEFKDPAITDLKYCVKDVRDLSRELSKGENVDTLLLINEKVTKEEIVKLKQRLLRTTVHDRVIISCSSHGSLDEHSRFYLAMHDTEADQPGSKGLSYEELSGLLDGIPARQKLLLLDACNSGENDATQAVKKSNPENRDLISENSRGAGAENANANANSTFETMMKLFVNVSNPTGAVIISAAGGQESALEAINVDGKTIENGAFTYSILECLKQNEGKELKVNTLKQYAEKRVEEITNGKQKPTSRQETMEVDWGVR